MRRNDALAQEIRNFKPLVKGQRWEAYYPLGRVQTTTADQSFSGRVFLYSGGATADFITASPHFSIDYKLQIDKGRLTADSDLRMGAILLPNAILLTPADKISIDEWYSDRPLPEIVGGNTADKALLGIKAHEERLGTTLEKDSSEDD